MAWSLGAAGVGFCVGYCIAASVKGESEDEYDYVRTTNRSYAQPILGDVHQAVSSNLVEETNGDKHEGPGLVQRFKETRAFDRLQQEVGTLGDRLIDELSTTAQTVVLPALIRRIRDLIGADLSDKSQSRTTTARPASLVAAQGINRPWNEIRVDARQIKRKKRNRRAHEGSPVLFRQPLVDHRADIVLRGNFSSRMAAL